MFLFPEFTDMVENPGVPDVGLICEWGDSSQAIGLCWHNDILWLGFLWYQALGHSRNFECHNVL